MAKAKSESGKSNLQPIPAFPENGEKVEYKGNAFVTGDDQKTFAELMQRMKSRPELAKMMIVEPSWDKVTAILLFLILEHLERKG